MAAKKYENAEKIAELLGAGGLKNASERLLSSEKQLSEILKKLTALEEEKIRAEAEAAEFIPVGDENDKADKPDVRINLNYSAPVKRIGYAFARRKFPSDCERTVYAAFGADWWGEVFVNGEKALDVRSGWKPTPFPLRLKKGDNEVLVVVHGGSRQHWFVFYVNDGC